MKNFKCQGQHSPSKICWSGAHCCLLLLLLVWIGNSRALAATTIFMFDDLPGNLTPVPNGYGGFQWNNFYVLNAVTYTGNPSGYGAGMISQANVAYNAGGTPAQLSSANPFNLYSGYFTGAWNDALQLQVRGYVGVTLAYDHTYTLSATTPTLIDFNYFDVTTVSFNSFGGSHHPGYDAGSGTHFAMDNLTVTTVPEPSGVVSLAVGMMAWAIGRRGELRGKLKN